MTSSDHTSANREQIIDLQKRIAAVYYGESKENLRELVAELQVCNARRSPEDIAAAMRDLAEQDARLEAQRTANRKARKAAKAGR